MNSARIHKTQIFLCATLIILFLLWSLVDVWVMRLSKAFDAFFVNPWGESLGCHQIWHAFDMSAPRIWRRVTAPHKNTHSFKAPWLGEFLLLSQTFVSSCLVVNPHVCAVKSSFRVHRKTWYRYTVVKEQLVCGFNLLSRFPVMWQLTIDHGAVFVWICCVTTF